MPSLPAPNVLAQLGVSRLWSTFGDALAVFDDVDVSSP
jgi:hypothetical protein